MLNARNHGNRMNLLEHSSLRKNKIGKFEELLLLALKGMLKVNTHNNSNEGYDVERA